MPAVRKLDQAALDQIVAGRAAGQSFRKLAEGIEVDQSTLSRRVRSDPELQAAISAAKKRAARLTRDRERKARAKARREAAAPPAAAPEPGQGLAAGLDGGPPLEQADHARKRLRASARDDRVEDGSVDGVLRSRFRFGTEEHWLDERRARPRPSREPRVRLVTESGKTAGSTSASNAERMRAALEPRHGPLRVVLVPA